MEGFPTGTKFVMVPQNIIKENWSEVKLVNGDTVKAKVVIRAIYGLFKEDGEPMVDEFGQRQYAVQTALIVQCENKQMLNS